MAEATPLFSRINPTVVSRRVSRAFGARPQALAGVGRTDDAYGDRILVFRRQKTSQTPLLEQLTLACGKGYRIPEPTRQADLLADRAKHEGEGETRGQGELF